MKKLPMLLFMLLIIYMKLLSQDLNVNEKVREQITNDYFTIYHKIKSNSELVTYLNQVDVDFNNVTVNEGFKAIIPFDLPNDNQVHKHLFKTQAKYWKQNNTNDLVIWKTNNWDFLSHLADPPKSSQIPNLDVYMMKNEYRSASFNISNATLSDKEIKIKITVNGIDNPDYITVSEVLWTGTILEGNASVPVPAALPNINKSTFGFDITIIPGMTKQIWLTFNPTSDVSTNSAAITLYENNNLIGTIPLSLEIYPYTFPTKPTLHFGGYDELNVNNKRGITPENHQLIKDYLSKYFVKPSGSAEAIFDKGNFYSDASYQRFPYSSRIVNWVSSWPSEDYYLHAALGHYPIDMQSDNKFEIGTLNFKTAVQNWSLFWDEKFEDIGVNPENIYLNLIDEPRGAKQTELLKYAEAIHESGSKMKVWGDFTMEFRDITSIDDINEDMVESFDVFTPGRISFDKNAYGFRDFVVDHMNTKNRDSKIFVWNGSSQGLKKTYETKGEYSSSYVQRDNANYYEGDFNGDGKTDLTAFYKYPSSNSKIQTWEGSDVGLQQLYKVRAEFISDNYTRDNADYYTGDFNGDGYIDLLAFYKYSNGDSKIFEWDGSANGLSLHYKVRAQFTSSNYTRDAAEYYTGDFNGDGYSDLLAFYKYSNGNSKMFVWDGTASGLSLHYDVRAEFTSSNYTRDVADYYTGDFNGDGSTDLLAFYKYSNGNSKMFVWDGSASGLSLHYDVRAEFISDNYTRDVADYYTGDFNGDGKTDLLAFYQYSTGSKKLQIYACEGWTKLLDPYFYYRMQPWLCWAYNATGSHFWSFTDNGSVSSWNEYAANKVPCTPFYIDDYSVTSGKHMEAAREGVQDYEYFVMLNSKIKEGRDSNIDPVIIENATSLLNVGVSEVYENCGLVSNRNSYSWNKIRNRLGADAIRKDILDYMLAIDTEMTLKTNSETKSSKEITDCITKDPVNDFVIFPNPTSGKVKIYFTNKLKTDTQLSIYDISGCFIQSSSLLVNEKNHTIDLSSYSSGVYIVKLSTLNETVIKQIIKN